jgi:L-fuconate dehydratase
VPVAIERTLALREFEPYWMEEPTSPDDALGHAAIARAIAPVKVATGEHCMNRVLFKQLMQADAIGVCQVDACRLGGVNEVLAVLLLAAQFGIPVCPHSGGVGLCELTQHLSIVDYICVGASLDGRLLEYVDHLHEHFTDPVRMRGGRYLAPSQPGYSAEMKAESLDEFEFPGGAAWRS